MFNFKKVVNLTLSVSILGSVVAPTISFSGLFGKTTSKNVKLTKNQKAKLMLLNAAKKTGAGIAVAGKYAGKGLLTGTKAVGKGIWAATKATGNGVAKGVKYTGKNFAEGYVKTFGSIAAITTVAGFLGAVFLGYFVVQGEAGRDQGRLGLSQGFGDNLVGGIQKKLGIKDEGLFGLFAKNKEKKTVTNNTEDNEENGEEETNNLSENFSENLEKE